MDGAVEVPYCSICRRSSELKWRKHVFSKSHQRAAAELLIARCAKMAETRERIAACTISEELRHSSYCVFCELELKSLRHWVEHHAMAAHRKRIHEFCKHHRCDADQQLRPQLSLPSHEAATLIQAIGKQDAERDRKQEQEPPVFKPSEEFSIPTPSDAKKAAQAEAFLTSAAARLQQVNAVRARASSRVAEQQEPNSDAKPSWMGPHMNHFVRTRTVTFADGVQQNPLGRHEGKRVWGGGIVKLKKSELIQWGIDLLVAAEDERGLGDVGAATPGDAAENNSFLHRSTDAAFGAGLGSVHRVNWGENVANIHSAAVPPWMVDTEEEYKRRNRIAAPAAALNNGSAPASELRPPPHEPIAAAFGEGKDIFARLNPNYDERTWLPNFGSVWQEGSRHKTRREFKKTRTRESRSERQVQTPTTFVPLRSPSVYVPDEIRTQPHLPLTEQHSLPQPSAAPEVVKTAPASTAAGSTPTSEMDQKKALLMAQKERLRAKLAAKRPMES